MFRNLVSTSFRGNCRRRFGSLAGLQVSEEVRAAMAANKPVVALESTIITHGLPQGANVDMAETVEGIIRDHGAVPATIGFLNGTPVVGLSKPEIEEMADLSKPKYKVSRRDVAYVMSEGLTGGTTIAATMLLAHRAGIDVFSTGGLGGVSRPFELMDVSADLDELSKTPVSVVCSGPKSILDVGRTMEYLETKGVPVFTYDDGHFPEGVKNIPGFYTRDSGIKSPFTFSDYATAAKVVYNGKFQMEMQNGYVFCIPAPTEVALSSEFITKIIDEALEEAHKQGVRGKLLTPFMLARINELTKGKSVECNVDFVKNNAAIGAEIAKELSRLKSGGSEAADAARPRTQKLKKPVQPQLQPAFDTAVVGSVALDSTSVIGSNKTLKMGDSNPGTISHSVGGVGFNVALAASASGANTLFISALNGEDTAGSSILTRFKSLGMATDGLCSLPKERTAQYSSVHDENGKLIVACADMDIIERIPESHVGDMLAKYSPKFVLMDSNLSVPLINCVVRHCSEKHTTLLYEPTSGIKASKLGQANLHCYPHNEVSLMSPTTTELATVVESFQENGKFDDLDGWFGVLDALKLDRLRDQLERVGRKNAIARRYSEEGVFQQAFRLLPYVPNVLVKDGAIGILLVQLVDQDVGKPLHSDASFTIVQRGSNGLSVVVQQFPGLKIEPSEIKSVTGAGDSLVGYLLSRFGKEGRFFLSDLTDNARERALLNAQRAACLSLTSSDAVNAKELEQLN